MLASWTTGLDCADCDEEALIRALLVFPLIPQYYHRRPRTDQPCPETPPAALSLVGWNCFFLVQARVAWVPASNYRPPRPPHLPLTLLPFPSSVHHLFASSRVSVLLGSIRLDRDANRPHCSLLVAIVGSLCLCLCLSLLLLALPASVLSSFVLASSDFPW